MSSSARELFVRKLALIERITASIARRNGCFGDEAEEFASQVKLRLIEDDYGVLRKFQGRSRLSTYLTVVIHNLFRDYRIARWGKWRPSAAARRLGPVAVQLEILLSRDGFGFDEALEILRVNFHVAASAAEIAELAERLPPRTPRRIESDEPLERLAAVGGSEERLREAELAGRLAATEAALGRALAELGGEERRLLRLRFHDGFKVSEIARTLGVEPRSLYHRFERALARLRDHLEGQGLTWESVRELVGWKGAELELLGGGRGRRNSPARSVQTRGRL